jgi:hypothetical protein
MDTMNRNELIGLPGRLTRAPEATGKPAAIGRLGDARALLTGEAGTLVAA